MMFIHVCRITTVGADVKIVCVSSRPTYFEHGQDNRCVE
jgi:hypothetical protein